MKTQTLILISFIFTLISCSEKLPKEISFFENYDVKNGKYKVLVYGSEGEWIEDYKDFYIDDVKTLDKMKRQWVFNKKSDVMPCGYGYNIYLVDEENILKNVAVNIECEYMSSWIKFPKKYLTKHQKYFKRMTEEDKTKFEAIYFKNKVE
ncbi:MAG: hypothetical protein RBT46_07630 [Weeksellaceae bacterium]|jgi:hypothetical protein|nr:hypothetical protein [Weeksellaceae bacterium]MDX9705561.1 hypothetical protein [Weeksellaceae bacterium]